LQRATSAEAAFKKINWNVFDIVRQTPLASNAGTLKQVIALKAAVLSEHGKSVKPTIDGLHVLARKAKAAAVTLGKNPLFKDGAKAAAGIDTEASHFAVALALNSLFFEAVAKDWEKSKKDRRTPSR